MFLSDIVFTSTKLFEIYFSLKTYLDLWHFQLIFWKKKIVVSSAQVEFVVWFFNVFTANVKTFRVLTFMKSKKFSNKKHCTNSTAIKKMFEFFLLLAKFKAFDGKSCKKLNVNSIFLVFLFREKYHLFHLELFHYKNIKWYNLDLGYKKL